MTTTPKHEAERLADELVKYERDYVTTDFVADMVLKSAEQLRRIPALEARVAELEQEVHNLNWALGSEGYDQMATPEQQAEHEQGMQAVNANLERMKANAELHKKLVPEGMTALERLAELEAQRVALTDEQIGAIRDAIQYSESGKVPEGWTVNRLQEIFDAHHGIGTKEGGEG